MLAIFEMFVVVCVQELSVTQFVLNRIIIDRM